MYSRSLSLKALFLSVLLVCSFSPKANDSLSQAELDQILAPVALYPDTVLTHVLIAATYPLEVVQAARWSKRHAGLSGDAAVQAVESEDWEPSVKALVAFPDLLQRLSDDLAWTQQLGEMFLTDEAAVLASIQQLRERAYQQGSLDKMKHLNVQRERQIIVIEPRQPEVIYVPYYDTRVVYGNWRWSAYPPVYWHAPRGFHTSSYFYWGPSFNVRPSFYFSIFDWHQHHIVINQHYYHNPPRYYPRRNKHYTDASRWQHDSYHRRGVHYRHEVLNRQHNFGYARQVTKEYRAQPANRRDYANDRQVTRNQVSNNQVSNSRERNQPDYQRRTADQVNLRQAPAVTSSRQLNEQQRAQRPVRELRESNRDTQVVRQREQQTRPEQRITPVPRQQPQVQSQRQPQHQAQQVPQVQRQAQPMPQAQPQRQMQQMQRPQVQRQEVSVSREVRGERANRSIE